VLHRAEHANSGPASHGSGTIPGVGLKTELPVATEHPNRGSTLGFLAWTLVGAAVAFFVPWVTFYVEPNDSSPWWTTWVPVGAWLSTGIVGLAWLVAGGRVRRIGVALVLGDILGFVLFLASFFYAFTHTNIGWD
jgi:hypothetical protein